MAYADLKDLLRHLERAGELTRIRVPVDPYLEVAEIVTRVQREGGPALLFENVDGSRMPLAINVFGTERRMAMCLGVDSLDEHGARIASLLTPEIPHGLSGLREAFAKVGDLRGAPPKKVSGKAACQHTVLRGEDVDLDLLPGLQAWPQDGGRFLNLGLTHTKHPETGARNLGMYRLQQHDRRTVGLHWQIHKDSNAHHAVAERRGERLPVAIAFGVDPAVTYAASAPLPAEIDEYLFAGFLRRERVELTDCVSVPLQVPANAQGRPRGLARAGVCVTTRGRSATTPASTRRSNRSPALTVETMTMASDPIFTSIVVGRPPQEDGPIGKATERIFLPLLRLTIPEIVDYDLPVEGVFHNCAIVSIDKRYPKHAQKVMNAIWGAGTDVADQADRHRRRRLRRARLPRRRVAGVRERRLRARPAADRGPCRPPRPRRVLPVLRGEGGHRRDGEAPDRGLHPRGWPTMITPDPAVADRVTRRWTEYGL